MSQPITFVFEGSGVRSTHLDPLGTATPRALCPDLLRYEQIGEADGWRGRIVRAFFWVLRAWPPR